MAVRKSRYGKFLGCTGYPGCRNIKRIDSVIEDEKVSGKGSGDNKKQPFKEKTYKSKIVSGEQ